MDTVLPKAPIAHIMIFIPIFWGKHSFCFEIYRNDVEKPHEICRHRYFIYFSELRTLFIPWLFEWVLKVSRGFELRWNVAIKDGFWKWTEKLFGIFRDLIINGSVSFYTILKVNRVIRANLNAKNAFKKVIFRSLTINNRIENDVYLVQSPALKKNPRVHHKIYQPRAQLQ